MPTIRMLREYNVEHLGKWKTLHVGVEYSDLTDSQCAALVGMGLAMEVAAPPPLETKVKAKPKARRKSKSK